MRSSHSRRLAAFTLVEILVVIGVIVLLAAILLPAISAFRNSATKASAVAQLNSIRTALQQYYADFNTYPESHATSAANQTAGAYSGLIGVNRGPAMLAQGLMGYLPYAQDGAGPLDPYADPNNKESNYGFRTRQSAMGGKIYGPYMSTDSKEYRRNNTATPSPDGHPMPADESFVDPWGNEILYYKSTRSGPTDTASGVNRIFGDIDFLQSNSTTEVGFFGYKDCYYVRDAKGAPIIAPSPTNAPDSFFKLLNSTTLNNVAGKVLGDDSFLLISAGPDGIYFTGDDIVMTKQ